jgi:hypothetical protein
MSLRAGEHFHLHVAVLVEAEVPEVAARLGQRGIERAIVQIEHRTIGIARVVFRDGFQGRACHGGARRLDHDADALIDRLLQRQQAVLRIAFAVERDQLEPGPTEHAAARVHAFDAHAQMREKAVAHVGERAAEGVDVGDADVLSRKCVGRCCEQQTRDQGMLGSHGSSPLVILGLLAA